MLSIDYFALFGLKQKFNLDLKDLEKRWMKIIEKIHPDRFALLSDIEKEISLNYSSYVNNAYYTLLNPIKRAIYICEKNGVSLNSIQNNLSEEFLDQQIQWREKINSDKKPILIGLYQELKDRNNLMLSDIIRLIDLQENYVDASFKISEWMFIDKIFNDLNRILSINI